MVPEITQANHLETRAVSPERKTSEFRSALVKAISSQFPHPTPRPSAQQVITLSYQPGCPVVAILRAAQVARTSEEQQLLIDHGLKVGLQSSVKIQSRGKVGRILKRRRVELGVCRQRWGKFHNYFSFCPLKHSFFHGLTSQGGLM